VRIFLKQNPDIAKDIEGRVRDIVFPKPEQNDKIEAGEPVEAEA